jgi:hypothetical protein
MAVTETTHVVDLAALAGLGLVISVSAYSTFSGHGLLFRLLAHHKNIAGSYHHH